MATRGGASDKRGLVVTLVFFILITIGLGVATYYGFADKKKLTDAKEKAEGDLVSMKTSRDWYVFEAAQLRKDIGFAPAPDTLVGGELRRKADFDKGQGLFHKDDDFKDV